MNITAGPDLSLGEYSDVVASSKPSLPSTRWSRSVPLSIRTCATKLHVTVVATGLGAKIEKPVKVIDKYRSAHRPPAKQRAAPAPGARNCRGQLP